MTARHILIPIHDFNAGGTEAIAFRLAGAWIAAGRRVSIVAGASNGPMRARVPEGADIRVLTPERRRSPISRLFLGEPIAEAARRLAPDAIFIPGNFHFVLAASLKRAMPGAPVVAKISNPLLPADAAPATPVHRLALNWWTRGIDHFVAMAPVLADHARLVLQNKAVTAIADPFLSEGTPVVARSGTPADFHPLRLLAVGRLEPQKDMALAIHALLHVRQTREALLTILGDGSGRERLERLAHRLGLDDAVTLRGHVDDVRRYMAEHDLFLMTSRFEGVPAVIGEALSTGLPFVATDCSAWLRDLAGRCPALGSIAASRAPEALAATTLATASRRYPRAEEIDEGVAPHRLPAAAAGYLALFDRLRLQNG